MLYGRVNEGEGQIYFKSMKKRDPRSRNSVDPVIRVLIIYNTAAGEPGPRNAPSEENFKSTVFQKTQKTYKTPMDFNRSGFRENSPREIHFYFCHTSAAIFVGGSFCIVGLRWF